MSWDSLHLAAILWARMAAGQHTNLMLTASKVVYVRPLDRTPPPDLRHTIEVRYRYLRRLERLRGCVLEGVGCTNLPNGPHTNSCVDLRRALWRAKSAPRISFSARNANKEYELHHLAVCLYLAFSRKVFSPGIGRLRACGRYAAGTLSRGRCVHSCAVRADQAAYDQFMVKQTVFT